MQPRNRLDGAGACISAGVGSVLIRFQLELSSAKMFSRPRCNTQVTPAAENVFLRKEVISLCSKIHIFR